MMNDILAQVWNCLVQSSQLYIDKVVNSDSVDINNQSSNLGSQNSSNNGDDDG